tara:strand:+ start:378 stop:1592 length:1215 start_codon:yes stop_codon:yes gene_type:complete
MRDIFPWYFHTEADYEAIWDKGILTVDTNVILDLYRYNNSTREALLVALESFAGRFWISHQTAKEFIKNRRAVIADVSSDFIRASKPVDDVEKATKSAADAIRGCRVIPKEFSQALEAEVQKACQTIRDKIEKEKSEFPEYEASDDVVSRLEKALTGEVGTEPDDVESLLKEAQRRRDEKVPPGYMDEQKDGLGFAGDYLMWSQILGYSKEKEKPVILVTSETKEDWWEKKSGRTLNPRLELLQEAFEKTGQKFLIYHTDQFLRLHQEKSGTESDESILEEIREYSLAREPAVSVTQEVSLQNNSANEGALLVSLSRPVKNFTSSGRFAPNLANVPEIHAKLIETPAGTPSFTINANTGTTYDFNVHVHSGERGVMLPVGEYLIEYDASCDDPADLEEPDGVAG